MTSQTLGYSAWRAGKISAGIAAYGPGSGQDKVQIGGQSYFRRPGSIGVRSRNILRVERTVLGTRVSQKLYCYAVAARSLCEAAGENHGSWLRRASLCPFPCLFTYGL